MSLPVSSTIKVVCAYQTSPGYPKASVFAFVQDEPVVTVVGSNNVFAITGTVVTNPNSFSKTTLTSTQAFTVIPSNYNVIATITGTGGSPVTETSIFSIFDCYVDIVHDNTSIYRYRPTEAIAHPAVTYGTLADPAFAIGISSNAAVITKNYNLVDTLGSGVRCPVLQLKTFTLSEIFGPDAVVPAPDPSGGKLWVLNLDTNKWQVPWTVNASAIHSGETADGVVDLMVGLDGTTLVKMTPDTFTDNGTPYDAWVRGNLFDLAGERTTGRSAVVSYLELERNAVPLTDVKQLNDDSTHYAAGYTSIFAYEQDPPQRAQGTEIVAKRYMSSPAAIGTGPAACKRASFEMHWGAASDKFELYVMDVGYKPANK